MSLVTRWAFSFLRWLLLVACVVTAVLSVRSGSYHDFFVHSSPEIAYMCEVEQGIICFSIQPSSNFGRGGEPSDWYWNSDKIFGGQSPPVADADKPLFNRDGFAVSRTQRTASGTFHKGL
jgi:hypothetical protein